MVHVYLIFTRKVASRGWRELLHPRCTCATYDTFARPSQRPSAMNQLWINRGCRYFAKIKLPTLLCLPICRNLGQIYHSDVSFRAFIRWMKPFLYWFALIVSTNGETPIYNIMNFCSFFGNRVIDIHRKMRLKYLIYANKFWSMDWNSLLNLSISILT